MKYYIIAGEASGDLHGSNLIREIQKLDAQTEFRCWGGDLMKEAGATIVKHYRDLAFMGFLEILTNLGTILRNLKFCKKDITQFKPDCLVLIDYPGFNLRIVRWARNAGFKIIYYISPQVWAWKESRVILIKKFVDKMLVILPFEKQFYKKWGLDVEYVGHPLVEVVENYRKQAEGNKAVAVLPLLSQRPELTSAKIIALLPGSRKQEIMKKLPIMLAMTPRFPDHQFVVAQAPGIEEAFYEHHLKDYPRVCSVRNKTYDLLNCATAACVTSGTATLETALFGVPEVVCYKGSAVSYQIAKWLVNVKYISLVNLIMDKPVVKELIQEDLTVDHLYSELKDLLTNSVRQEQIREDYRHLKHALSQGGHASANAARAILNQLQP